MAIAIGLHILAAMIWIGGMFFAHMVLRPSALDLEPPARLPLWGRVLKRFFVWVWCAVIVLLLSGYYMIFDFYGGLAKLPIYLHLMHGIGWIMFFIFMHLWFTPYSRFKRALSKGDLPEAATNLNKIRQLVTINLVLGLVNAVIGASGVYI